MQQTLGRIRTAHGVRIEWIILGAVFAMKTLIVIFGGLVVEVLDQRRLETWHDWLQVWNLWDAPHYLDLARYGYQNSGELRLFLVFYPLYPWLTRLAAAPFEHVIVGAFLVSAIASVAAALLLYRLTTLDETQQIGLRAVWFLLIFPTSYFLHIGYTESLFLALTLGSLLAARRGNWALAGIIGAFASLTRVNGLVLLPTLAVEVFLQWRQTRRWEWQWAWIGAVGLGFGGYLLLNYRVAGDPFTFLTIQREHWYKSLAWPWIGIRDMIASFPWRSADEIALIFVPELLFIAFGTFMTIIAWRTLRPTYSVWMTLNLLLFISTSFILSVPRYTLILFPLFILLARASRRRSIFAWTSAVSLLLLAGFIMIFVTKQGAY